jgi:hypothetical protein
VAGTERTAAWIVRRPGGTADSVVRFELLPADSASTATYSLRANVGWLRPPPQVTLGGSAATVAVPFQAGGLARPGAYTGTVSGWGPDTLAGPAFRLVVTVVVPAPAAADSVALRSGIAVPAGSVLRSFFLADTARPFEVLVATATTEQGIAFLHEPDGAPYREGNAAPVGQEPATYHVDGRDVRGGAYEVDITPAPHRGVSATVAVRHAPYTMRAARTGGGVVVQLTGVAATAQAELKMGLIGVERTETVVARGSAERRIPFVLPSWATAVVIDVSMDRSQWGRFTDFGVTLFGSTGRQLGKDPLEYAFGRLEVDVAKGQNDRQVTLGLFPGFADPADSADWSAGVSIRIYADTMVALSRAGGGASQVTVARGATIARRFDLPESPWPLGEGFFPLGVLVAETGGRTWTRETGLAPASGSAAVR